ncbi:MAG TPA: fluoride efflux transporter CrcB [Firmicutes bacterium]|nr:fluoride efflux transporter CrcB [Bacillota bacterium]
MDIARVLLVGLGGFVGAVLRYSLGGFVHRYLDAARFPYGTFTVNLLGCLAIGFLAGMADARGAFTPELRVFVFVGLIGAFTTFSTFTYETMSFLRDGQALAAVVNVALHVLLGLAAVWAGDALSRWM